MKTRLQQLNEQIKRKSVRVKELKSEGNEKGAFLVFQELEEARKEKTLINKFLKA